MRSPRLPSLLLACVLSGTSAAAVDKSTELRDLHYGEALYQLYQDKHFSAIVRLLTAKKQGHMQAYEHEPDLLLGGLYLAYDMPGAAEAKFRQILDKGALPEIHDRAWLQLARTHHRHGQADSAAQAMGRVGANLVGDSAEERQVLDGLIALERGDNRLAGETLAGMEEDSEWSHYGRYNRAIALLRDGQAEAGLQLLEEIGDIDAETAEMKAVKDRANLVRGLMLIEAKQPDKARESLERVRIAGMDTNQALFGLGLASLTQEDPKGALPPWRMLAREDARDPTVLEVLLAIPYALNLLGDEQQSLEAYRQGIDRYSRELRRTDQAIGAIHQGELLAALEALHDRRAPDDDGLLSLLPLLLSENRFQTRWYNYLDLRFLQANLQDWNHKIDDYQSMLQVRQAAYEKVMPQVEEKLSGERIGQLKSTRDGLDQRLQAAVAADEPAFALSDGKTKKLLARIEKAEALIAQVGERRDLSEQIAKLRVLRGLLVWQDVTEHPARRRAVEKALRTLDATLAQAEQRQAALAEAHRQTRGGFGRFGGEIATLEDQVRTQLAEAKRLRQAQGEQLERMAIAVLDARKQLIHNYLIQARFGVASLLDRGSAQGDEAQ